MSPAEDGLASHARGRWFEITRAHRRKPRYGGGFFLPARWPPRAGPSLSARSVPNPLPDIRARLAVVTRDRDKGMRLAYGAFAGVAVVLIVVTEVWPHGDTIGIYGPNIVAELIGILLTVLVVERLLRWERERQLDPLRRVATARAVSDRFPCRSDRQDVQGIRRPRFSPARVPEPRTPSPQDRSAVECVPWQPSRRAA